MKKTLSILMLLAAFSIQGTKHYKTSKDNTLNVKGTVDNINGTLFEFDDNGMPLGHAVANGLEAHHFDNQCQTARDKKAKSQEANAKKQEAAASKEEAAARKRAASSETKKQVKTKKASTKVTTVDHSDHHKVVQDENGQVWHCSPMMQAENTESTSKADAKDARANAKRARADAKVSRANAKRAKANAKRAKVVTIQE